MLVALGSWSLVIDALLPFPSMLPTAVGALPGLLALIGEHFVTASIVAYGPLALSLEPAPRRQSG
jgi:hypothetical protein